jgi:hypothetical protein
MQVYLVTASINPLENLSMPRDCSSVETKILVIDEGDIGVRKVNEKLLSGVHHEFYGPRERAKWFKDRFGKSYTKYLKLIPEKCHAESSFGFLKAYEEEPLLYWSWMMMFTFQTVFWKRISTICPAMTESP